MKIKPYIIVIILLAALIITGMPNVINAQAESNLLITNVNIETKGDEAIIKWQTNRSATARVHFGLTSNYTKFIEAGVAPKVYHEVTLPDLKPETVYHMQIVASDTIGGLTTSNDISFKTKKGDVADSPLISEVNAPYVTASTATITWKTDIKSSSTVRYGTTSKYTNSASGPGNVTEHQVTIKGLKNGTLYHFTVESKADKSVASKYHDLTFTTPLSKEGETMEFKITNVEPADSKSPNIGTSGVVISWQTNKLASGWVDYGTSPKFGKRITQPKPDTFFHTIAIQNLNPDTTYYFRVGSRDIFGKTVETQAQNVKTRGTTVFEEVKVLGATTERKVENPTPASKLVKLAGNPTVYAVLNGKLHKIASPSVFNANGYKWNAITNISNATLQKYSPITLIKAANSSTVYFTDETRRIIKPIPSPSVFESYSQNKWENIVTVTAEDINTYKTTYVVKTKDSPQVFLLNYQTNARESFANEQAFLKRGFDWKDIIKINQTELNHYRFAGELK